MLKIVFLLSLIAACSSLEKSEVYDNPQDLGTFSINESAGRIR